VAYTKHIVKSAYVPSAQIKSRIEKGANGRKIAPTTELLFEMKDPPRTRYRIPAEPLKLKPMVVRDDGDDKILGEGVELDCKDVLAPLEGERPLTAGDVHRPPPKKRREMVNLAAGRNFRGHWGPKRERH